MAFKDFLYSGANSAVFFLSRNLKNDNISLWEKYYNKEFLEKFAKMLNFNVEIYSLKAKDFHDKNDEKEATNGEFANAKKELENGKRVAIFTTYQALGVGQNIQYKFDPKKLPNLIKINDFDNKNLEKDWDYIYLEKPTNIFDDEDEKYANQLFATYVYSELAFISNISKAEMDKLFRIIWLGGQNIFAENDKDFVANAVCVVLEQAVGRICRTNYKNPKIYIMYDVDIKKILSRAKHSRFPTKEFEVLYKHIGVNIDKTIKPKDFMPNNVGKNIIKMLIQRDDQKFLQMQVYKEFREFLLKNPTLSRENFNEAKGYFRQGYFAYDEKIDLVFIDKKDIHLSDHIKLDEILPAKLKEIFLAKGYATQIRP